MTVRFVHETRIEAPMELVFDLSLNVDAHRASMSASNERAIAGVTSGRIDRTKHDGPNPWLMSQRPRVALPSS